MGNAFAYQFVRFAAVDGLASQGDAAFARCQRTGNGFHQGSLAGTVGTQNGDHRAFMDIDGYPAQGHHRAIKRFQVLHLQQGLGAQGFLCRVTHDVASVPR